MVDELATAPLRTAWKKNLWSGEEANEIGEARRKWAGRSLHFGGQAMGFMVERNGELSILLEDLPPTTTPQAFSDDAWTW
jgi:hypothetical protein